MLAMVVNDNAPCLMTALSGRSSRAGSLLQWDRGQACNQVGCQAASLWLLLCFGF